MLKFFGSIRGLVFFIMSVALVALTFIKIIDAKDFMVLASMSFAAYFSKGRDIPPTI